MPYVYRVKPNTRVKDGTPRDAFDWFLWPYDAAQFWELSERAINSSLGSDAEPGTLNGNDVTIVWWEDETGGVIKDIEPGRHVPDFEVRIGEGDFEE